MAEMNTYNYRELLSKELASRKRRNPRYSQRAFARDLEVSQPFLSEVIAGKKSFSKKQIKKFLENIKLSELEKQEFITHFLQEWWKRDDR